MSGSNGTTHVVPSAGDLLQRCQLLCTELDQFREHLKTQNRRIDVRISYFHGNVVSELKHVEKIIQRAHDSVDSVEHNVASSNVPSYEAIWNTVKTSTGLVALQKYFYFDAVPENQEPNKTRPGTGDGNGDRVHMRRGKVLVNVVAHDGREWIKVSLATNHRILMDKAKEGWGEDDSDDEGEADEESDVEAESDIPIVRMTKELLEAAKEVKVRGGRPRVRLVLPKIVERKDAPVDRIVSRLRALGATVDCADLAPPSVPLQDAIDHILTDSFAGLTSTLNIDCTVLLALVSDISHFAVKSKPWYHRTLGKQVEIEEQESLLLGSIYPALCGRRLVCTREAAARMQEIVDTIGTESERARTNLLMGVCDITDQATLQSKLQNLSKIEVPEDLQLPVQIVDKDVGDKDLSSAAAAFKSSAIPMNQSVFLYGWNNGFTTVTSNHTVVKKLESILQEHSTGEEDWPKVWLCPYARSLVGKDHKPRVIKDMMVRQIPKNGLG